jgi:hypothetical protein
MWIDRGLSSRIACTSNIARILGGSVTIRWLHLSDVHECEREGHFRKRMYEQIIEQGVKGHAPPDLVFLTGDMAFAGNASARAYYVMLFFLSLSSATFLFGAMRSIASLRGMHLGAAYEFGGPAVIAIVVVLGGFYPTNTAAIARVVELAARDDFHNPFIIEKSGEDLWNAVELGRVCSGDDSGAPTLVNLLRRLGAGNESSAWMVMTSPKHLCGRYRSTTFWNAKSGAPPRRALRWYVSAIFFRFRASWIC